jgi:hypothetical protein
MNQLADSAFDRAPFIIPLKQHNDRERTHQHKILRKGTGYSYACSLVMKGSKQQTMSSRQTASLAFSAGLGYSLSSH